MFDRRTVVKAAVGLLIALEAVMLMPYKDGAGVWTDGVGNTHNVVPGVPITREKAMADLDKNIQTYMVGVEKSLTKPTTNNQLLAYTSFAYNIGVHGFRTSSTAKAHNAAHYMDACLYMLRWTKITVNGKKVESKGLWNRRYKEYNYCISGVPNVRWTKV